MSSHGKRSPWTEILVNVLGCFYSPRILSIMGWKRLGRRLRDSGFSLKLCPGREVKNTKEGTSLVGQQLRVRLPMQGTRVRCLVREDPTCHGATRPVRHNC